MAAGPLRTHSLGDDDRARLRGGRHSGGQGRQGGEEGRAKDAGHVRQVEGRPRRLRYRRVMPTGALSRLPFVLAFARREPSAILLAAQLAGVLLYPFMEGSDVGRSLFSVFGIAILGLVVLAVRSLSLIHI